MRFSVKVLQDSLTLYLPNSEELIEELPIVLARPEHKSFIISTWVRSYEKTARKLSFCGMPMDKDWRIGESARAEKWWEKARVVTSKDDPYTIHAWICGSNSHGGHLFYVYVPPNLRGNGIAKALVEKYVGQEYSVSLPWPNQPHQHKVTYYPWV